MRRINLHMQGGGVRRCGASLTDDNAAYGDLDKQNVQIISEQCQIKDLNRGTVAAV
jgi:hypothetical protein